MENKNKLWRDSFLEYCIKHPQERFFQALKNWCEAEVDPSIGFVYFGKSDDQLDFTDTFYLTPENKEELLTK